MNVVTKLALTFLTWLVCVAIAAAAVEFATGAPRSGFVPFVTLLLMLPPVVWIWRRRAKSDRCPTCGALAWKCQRDFWGFWRCACEECQVQVIEPLTKKYRVAYWLVGGGLGLSCLTEVPSIVDVAGVDWAAALHLALDYWMILLFVVGSVVALHKDARLRADTAMAIDG